MRTSSQFIMSVTGSLFLLSSAYAAENPCTQNPSSLACLSLKNPQSLAGDCSRDLNSRSCVCAQSCGVSTLSTHAEALDHPGYATCYKKGVVSPFSGCLGLTKAPVNLLDAWADAGSALIR